MIYKVVRQGDYILCRPMWMFTEDPIAYFYRYKMLYVFRVYGAFFDGVTAIDKPANLT